MKKVTPKMAIARKQIKSYKVNQVVCVEYRHDTWRLLVTVYGVVNVGSSKLYCITHCIKKNVNNKTRFFF